MKFPIRYFISLSLWVALFVIGAWWVQQQNPEWQKPLYLPVTVGVVYVLTLLSHIFVRGAALFRGKSFVQMITLSMVARISMYGLFALVVILFHPGNPNPDIIYFAALYLFLTIFELVDVVRNPVRNQSGESGK